MGRQVFTAGEILTAANMNDLSDQSVMVFDDASARTTAIPTPVEGMVTYLSDEDEVQVFDGSAFKAVGPGKILQVVSTVKTDTFTTASTSFVDITGLTASITPSSTASKIYVVAFIQFGHSIDSFVAFNLDRDGSAIAQPGAGTDPATLSSSSNVVSAQAQATLAFLDSPATTSAITYNIEGRTTAPTLFINRTPNIANRTAISTITLMEVAG